VIVKYKPNKITATLRAVVAGEFHDGATGETVRRNVEQLLKAGFDVDVKLKYYTMDRISIEETKITAGLRLRVTGEFYDDEASEETLRYCVEQDLEDAGFYADVSVMRNGK
jgi:hypothetical protein